MSGPKFDINDGDFILGGDNLGLDSEGHLMMGIGDNMSMDIATGEIHITTGGFNIWGDEEDE